MCGISKAGQWQAAQALYVIGTVGKFVAPYPSPLPPPLLPQVMFTSRAKEQPKDIKELKDSPLLRSSGLGQSADIYIYIITATNVVTAFYAATFPGLVRDLPKLIRSEQDVQAGTKSSVLLCPSASFLYCPLLYALYSRHSHVLQSRGAFRTRRLRALQGESSRPLTW